MGDLETFKAKDAILREHCEAEGRDPDEIERTWGIRDRTLVPDLEPFLEAGVKQWIVGVGGDGEGYDLSRVREVLKQREALVG